MLLAVIIYAVQGKRHYISPVFFVEEERAGVLSCEVSTQGLLTSLISMSGKDIDQDLQLADWSSGTELGRYHIISMWYTQSPKVQLVVFK